MKKFYLKKRLEFLFLAIFLIEHATCQIKSGIFCMGDITTLEHVLSSYIQIPSLSGDEKMAGDFLKAICLENQLYVADFGSENNNFNFAASIFPLEYRKPNIIFLNHIDVVPNGLEEIWDYHPNSGNIEDGVIYGRGALDFKGVAIAQLFSIIHFSNEHKANNLDFNVSFLAVSCEESDCAGGAKHVVSNFLEDLNPIVVLGEGPPALTKIIGKDEKHPIYGIATAHKRSLWIQLDLSVDSFGHGSVTPRNYSNKAMVLALENLIKSKPKLIFNELNISILKSLAQFETGFTKLVLENPRFFKPLLFKRLREQPEVFALFSNTITITDIFTENNKGVYNVIPSKTYAYLDCRLLPEEDEQQFIKKLKKQLRYKNIGISIVTSMPPSKPSPRKNIFYAALEKSIKSYYDNSIVFPILLPSSNDSGKFRAKNINAYDIAPFDVPISSIQNIHKENESVPISALYDGFMVYLKFLNEVNPPKSIAISQ